MFLGKDQSVGATGLEGGQRREGMLALQTGSQPLCKHNNRWGGGCSSGGGGGGAAPPALETHICTGYTHVLNTTKHVSTVSVCAEQRGRRAVRF